MATVTNGAKESVGEVVATVFNNMGSQIAGNTEQQINRIGELLTKTQFKFQIRDFGQLGEGLKYATPAFKQFNIGLEQGLTLIGMLNTTSLQGGQAGTAFSATMRNMSKAARELGFEMVRTDNGQLDVIATLKNMDKAVGGLGNMSQETADKVQQLFGEEGVRMVSLLADKLHELDDAQRDVTEGSKDIVDESYNAFLESSAAQWDIFTDNLRIVGQVISGTLLPALNIVLTPLTGLFKWISRAAEKFPVLGWAIGGVVTGLVVMGGALTMIAAAQWGWNTAMASTWALAAKNLVVGGLLKGLILGKAAVLGVLTAAQWAFNAAAAANPLVWIVGGIIAAVAALGYGAYMLWKHWDEVVNWLGEQFDWLLDKLSFIGDIWDAVFGDGDKNIQARVETHLGDAQVAAASNAVAATSNTSHTTTQTNHFVINPTPGMDEEELARQVTRQLRNAQSESELALAP